MLSRRFPCNGYLNALNLKTLKLAEEIFIDQPAVHAQVRSSLRHLPLWSRDPITQILVGFLNLRDDKNKSFSNCTKKVEARYFYLSRNATVREIVLENEKCSRSGKSQGISFSVMEI